MPSSTTSGVILFSIDGMRPDGMMNANTPVMHRLMSEGAYTLNARSVMPSVTLPCHTSMLRGVRVERHGITSNDFHPLARPVPSVIDAAHAAGKRTGFFFNWGQLRDLCHPESLDVSYLFRDAITPEGDRKLASAAAEHLLHADFDFLFVYLGHTDECGHEHGWMSPQYLQAIENADACVAHVLEACEQTGRPRNVLLLSDHGGHGRSHGTNIDEDMNVPWVMHGPNIRPGAIESTLYLYDACPTLAHLLGIDRAREWDGRIASEAICGYPNDQL